MVTASRNDRDTARLIRQWRDGAHTSARTLLITIFGDALLPRRQAIGVQQLAELVRPFDINERLVRTSLHRLSREDLVIAEKQGRRSFYRVADGAIETFEHADRRIYHRPATEWDGSWTLAILDPTTSGAPASARLAQELDWLGMGRLAPGVYLSPSVDDAEVAHLAERTGGRLAVLARAPLTSAGSLGDRHLADLVTPQEELRKEFTRHVNRFSAFREDGGIADSPVDALVVRTLLVDSWRRLALRDLDLPHALVLGDWPADDAFELTKTAYRRLLPMSEVALDALLGPSSAAPPDRFP